MHLAELNIARLKYPFDDPRVAEFADNLDLVNGIAERSPGFVWRLKDETGNATDIRAFDDPLVIVNMSVWQDAESLEHFVWNTLHKRFYQRREHWFSLMRTQHFVMWWVDEGHAADASTRRRAASTISTCTATATTRSAGRICRM